MNNCNNSNEFEYLNFFKRMLLEQKELEKYYRELRKYELNNKNPEIGIKIRKKLNKILVLLFNISTYLSGQKLEILKDERITNDKPKIYAVTHIGRYDIEMSIKAIKENCYFVWGDPGLLYKSPEKILTNIIGTIFVDTDNKDDRHLSLETMCKLLNHGANIQIYPEGAWNLQKNEPVMKLYTGAVEAAIRTGAEIIPVAIEQYDKRYVVNIGKNIDLKDKQISDKRELTDELRNIMCTLKWEIWEQQGIYERKEIPENWYNEFVENIMKDSDNGYTLEEIERTRYKNKKNVSKEEVFSFIENIKINKNNYFLFQKQETFNTKNVVKVLKK